MDYTTLVFGILFGLSSPRIEQNIQDLESHAFLTRQKSFEYLKNEGSPYLFRYIIEGSKNGTLEKNRRMESIINHVNSKWINDIGVYYDRQWQLEGDYADLLFGTDWPRIDYVASPFRGGCFYNNKEDSTQIQGLLKDEKWYSFRVKCGRKKLLRENFNFAYTDFIKDCKYDFVVTTKSLRHLKYALELEHTRLPYDKAATKVWIIDQLNIGASPLFLSVVLSELRRREKLDKQILYHLGSRHFVRFYGNWENYKVPFITIRGKNQDDVPDPFIWSDFE